MSWLIALAGFAAALVTGPRWLRIAQREHYLPGEVLKFARRWWDSSAINRALLGIALLGIILAVVAHPLWSLLTAFAQVGPIGLSLRGVTSPLAWTDRLRRVAVLAAVLLSIPLAVSAVFDASWGVAATLVLVPSLVDLALFLLAPMERRLGDRWVEDAGRKLEAVAPQVVAITGSFGKTTTKNYLAHLIGGHRRVFASPASFNNRMGLARAVNEGLTPGTEVFIAEMGTYGYGEIADLCAWIPPDISAMVSIGPVHLERFGTTEDTARAKSEILERARVGVICVDYPELAAIADENDERMTVVRVSGKGGVTVDNRRVSDVPEGVFAQNLAVALGIGDALGVPIEDMIARFDGLTGAEHRQSVSTSPSGVVIIDDTFNSNPEGARSALESLNRVGNRRKAVVTPGMVELGHTQAEENRELARLAAEMADELVIVGRTNRKALLDGSANGRASVTVVDSRAEAVDWVRAHLAPGDAVLYENDLPDHYP